MPKSRRPRKKGRVRGPEDGAAVAQAHDAETRMAAEPPAREVPVHTSPPAPVQPHQTHAAPAPRAARGARRYGVPIAVGAAGAGGAAYLLHRRRRSNVGKGLINPLTGDRVVFEKSYIGDEYDEPRITFGKAGVFIPGGVMTNVSFGTGRTREDRAVSHANKVKHVRNRGASAR